MIVMTVSICSSRLTTGLDSPPPVRATAPDSLLSAKAWNAITVTMLVVVTATVAALRSERRGRAAVVERRDRASARRADGGNERRCERHHDRQPDDLHHCAQRERGCARSPDEGRARLGDQRRRQPARR